MYLLTWMLVVSAFSHCGSLGGFRPCLILLQILGGKVAEVRQIRQRNTIPISNSIAARGFMLTDMKWGGLVYAYSYNYRYRSDIMRDIMLKKPSWLVCFGLYSFFVVLSRLMEFEVDWGVVVHVWSMRRTIG